MIGINDLILSLLEEREEYRNFFGLEYIMNNLREFFKNPVRNVTIDLIRQILREHNKDVLAKKMEELAFIETGVREFDATLRDHVNHSVYVFLLGLLFDYHPNRLKIDKVLSWKLASLLHDIAYPVEIFARAEIKWYNSVDDIVNSILVEELPDREIQITDVHLIHDENLVSGKNAFNLISDRVREWRLQLDVKEYYLNALNQGFKDHGVLSALMILKVIDALYYVNNPNDEEGIIKNGLDWSYRFYKNHILDAISAVAIHNIPIDDLGGVIRYETAPTAYFLILCDTLQIWSRESGGRPILSPNSIKPSMEADHIRIELDIDQQEFNKVFQDMRKIVSNSFSLELFRNNERLYT